MTGRYAFTFVISIFFLTSCCRKPHNLTERKQYLTKYYDSGCYEKEVCRVVDRTLKHFEHKICCGPQSAVVFDVDDTLLWSYDESKKIEFGFIPKLFHDWVLSADLPAVPHVKRIYDFFVARGCHIIILTGRRHDEVEATLHNLAHIGITKIDRIIARDASELQLTAAEYKSNRRKILEAEGYNIIASVGDQQSDFDGGYCKFAVRIPNYTYTIY